MCACVGLCFSMLWIWGSSPLPVFLVLAPELVSVSIDNTHEGLLQGRIYFPLNLTHSVTVNLHSALDGETKIITATVSPKKSSWFDLSEMTTEPLRFGLWHWLEIVETGGAGHLLFQKPFLLNGKLGFGKVWEKCGISVLVNTMNPASRQPAPVRYVVREVRERERERQTDRQTVVSDTPGSDVTIVALKLATSLHFPLPKTRTFRFSILKWSPLQHWNLQWVHFLLPKNLHSLFWLSQLARRVIEDLRHMTNDRIYAFRPVPDCSSHRKYEL